MKIHFLSSLVRRFVALVILTAFVATSVVSPSYAQAMPWMPEPGAMVALSPAFMPAQLQGMVVDANDPFKFDFIMNKGEVALTDAQKQEEYTKLIKYFLASLAVPDQDQWVNLSPYEKDRMIPDDFGKTEMGRDLLAQDYLLKQIASSLTHPDQELGKAFWTRVYDEAYKRYGTTDVPANTINKVWITPDKATVYENGNTVYVLEHHLKVMMEQDYVALKENSLQGTAGLTEEDQLTKISSDMMKEVIIPAIEKEVNEGKNFAPLRQVFSGMLLSAWYKIALKESILGKLYADKDKTKGVDQDPKANQEIYNQYLAGLKKGVFNMIREDVDKYTNEMMPRKYFSGGAQKADYSQILERVTTVPPALAAAANVAGAANNTEVVATQVQSPEAAGVTKKTGADASQDAVEVDKDGYPVTTAAEWLEIAQRRAAAEGPQEVETDKDGFPKTTKLEWAEIAAKAEALNNEVDGWYQGLSSAAQREVDQSGFTREGFYRDKQEKGRRAMEAFDHAQADASQDTVEVDKDGYPVTTAAEWLEIAQRRAAAEGPQEVETDKDGFPKTTALEWAEIAAKAEALNNEVDGWYQGLSSAAQREVDQSGFTREGFYRDQQEKGRRAMEAFDHAQADASQADRKERAMRDLVSWRESFQKAQQEFIRSSSPQAEADMLAAVEEHNKLVTQLGSSFSPINLDVERRYIASSREEMKVAAAHAAKVKAAREGRVLADPRTSTLGELAVKIAKQIAAESPAFFGQSPGQIAFAYQNSINGVIKNMIQEEGLENFLTPWDVQQYLDFVPVASTQTVEQNERRPHEIAFVEGKEKTHLIRAARLGLREAMAMETIEIPLILIVGNEVASWPVPYYVNLTNRGIVSDKRVEYLIKAVAELGFEGEKFVPVIKRGEHVGVKHPFLGWASNKEARMDQLVDRFRGASETQYAEALATRMQEIEAREIAANKEKADAAEEDEKDDGARYGYPGFGTNGDWDRLQRRIQGEGYPVDREDQREERDAAQILEQAKQQAITDTINMFRSLNELIPEALRTLNVENTPAEIMGAFKAVAEKLPQDSYLTAFLRNRVGDIEGALRQERVDARRQAGDPLLKVLGDVWRGFAGTYRVFDEPYQMMSGPLQEELRAVEEMGAQEAVDHFRARAQEYKTREYVSSPLGKTERLADFTLADILLDAADRLDALAKEPLSQAKALAIQAGESAIEINKLLTSLDLLAWLDRRATNLGSAAQTESRYETYQTNIGERMRERYDVFAAMKKQVQDLLKTSADPAQILEQAKQRAITDTINMFRSLNQVTPEALSALNVQNTPAEIMGAFKAVAEKLPGDSYLTTFLQARVGDIEGALRQERVHARRQAGDPLLRLLDDVSLGIGGTYGIFGESFLMMLGSQLNEELRVVEEMGAQEAADHFRSRAQSYKTREHVPAAGTEQLADVSLANILLGAADRLDALAKEPLSQAKALAIKAGESAIEINQLMTPQELLAWLRNRGIDLGSAAGTENRYETWQPNIGTSLRDAYGVFRAMEKQVQDLLKTSVDPAQGKPIMVDGVDIASVLERIQNITTPNIGKGMIFQTVNGSVNLTIEAKKKALVEGYVKNSLSRTSPAIEQAVYNRIGLQDVTAGYRDRGYQIGSDQLVLAINVTLDAAQQKESPVYTAAVLGKADTQSLLTAFASQIQAFKQQANGPVTLRANDVVIENGNEGKPGMPQKLDSLGKGVKLTVTGWAMDNNVLIATVTGVRSKNAVAHIIVASVGEIESSYVDKMVKKATVKSVSGTTLQARVGFMSGRGYYWFNDYGVHWSPEDGESYEQEDGTKVYQRGEWRTMEAGSEIDGQRMPETQQEALSNVNAESGLVFALQEVFKAVKAGNKAAVEKTYANYKDYLARVNLSQQNQRNRGMRAADYTLLKQAEIEALPNAALKGKTEAELTAYDRGRQGQDAAQLKGGIDLNAANLDMQIKRDGKGMVLPVSEQNLENIKINGLVPVILNIRPGATLPLFSQMQASVTGASV